MSISDTTGLAAPGASLGTAMAFVVPTMPPAGPTVLVRRFSVDEYHRLGELGLIKPDERVELLEGIVTMMSPIGIAHFKSVTAAHEQLQKASHPGWQAVCQQPLRLQESEPEPDVMVLRGNVRDYTKLPEANDVGLVVEVADATLSQDRTTKARVYAAAGIPEYWIINLAERKLEVLRKPAAAVGQLPARYESLDVFGPEQTLDVVLDGTKVGTISVADMLP